MRTHEKALANALQLRRQVPKNGQPAAHHVETSPALIGTYQSPTATSSTSNAFAAALSLGSLSFASHNIKPVKLTLTPHHLFYLLSRFEEIGVPTGPMNIRLENIHAEASPANYVSFRSQSQRSKGRSDRDSIHSVSSVRSVMSGMSALWSNFGLSSSNAAIRTERAQAQLTADLKYLYSAFTKIPCLRLSPDRKSRRIGGYEEFPFDTAVPLLAFKNVSALELCDVDFRQFFGWDRLAEQLRSLTIKRGDVEDLTDLLTGIVLDDMDKRRRRSSKAQNSPVTTWPLSPSVKYGDIGRHNSAPGSPIVDDRLGQSSSPRNAYLAHKDLDASGSLQRPRTKSTSPSRPTSSKQEGAYRHVCGGTTKIRRSGSSSSNSSTHSNGRYRTGSSSNILAVGVLPVTKWRFLRHLSLADNSLTLIASISLAPLANTLHSLDLSSNLFTEIPDTLSTLTALRALNLSNCMIESLHSLARSPLPAIIALNLRANRLVSIAGVERLLSLERLDLRENKIQDPTETARLTGIPNIREIWITGNPLAKTHSNYRITIFNLFRSTPGFIEDIVIDALGPKYSERRQLRDRVAEPESVPVVKPIPIDPEMNMPGSFIDAPDISIENVENGAQKRPMPYTAQSEPSAGSRRRRKGAKRRIVDLARDENLRFVPHENNFEMPQETTLSAFGGGSGDKMDQQAPILSPRELFDTSFSGPSNLPIMSSPIRDPMKPPNQARSFANDVQNPNINGEAYRQKVEALKSEVGNNWLSVLSEDGWAEHRNPKPSDSDFGHINVRRPPLSSLQSKGQGVAGSNRTIG